MERWKQPAMSGVAALERALSMLSAFQRGDSILPLAEIARRTDLDDSTVVQLAASLEEAGFLYRLPEGRYQLGGEIARLGSIYQDALGLDRQILPVLRHLVEACGETASFYVRHGASRMCLYRVNSSHRLRLHLQPGDLRPMDRSSIAQALRATDPADSAVAHSSGATDPHAASMAIPVFLGGGAPLGALGVSGPATRLTADRLGEIAPMLRRAVRELLTGLNVGVYGDVSAGKPLRERR